MLLGDFRYMAEILPIRRKTLYNQSINQTLKPNFSKRFSFHRNYDKFMEKQDVKISKSLLSTANGVAPTMYLNLTDESSHLLKGSVVATVEKFEGAEDTSAGLV